MPLHYGTVHLEGYRYKDYVCLLQMNTTVDKMTQQYINQHYCLKDLRIQTSI